MEEKEIWKDIEGYKGYYMVSNLGRVKSVERTVLDNRGCYRTIPGKILKPSNNGKGYLFVTLRKDCRSKWYYVHQLVAQAFLENPLGYKELNHKNEEKSDNNVNNLEWCSRSYNLSYNGRAKKAGKKAGKKVSEKLRGRKLSEEHIKKMSKQVIGINKASGLVVKYSSTKEAERMTGIHHSNISACCKGKYKSAGGFVWYYADTEE